MSRLLLHLPCKHCLKFEARICKRSSSFAIKAFCNLFIKEYRDFFYIKCYQKEPKINRLSFISYISNDCVKRDKLKGVIILSHSGSSRVLKIMKKTCRIIFGINPALFLTFNELLKSVLHAGWLIHIINNYVMRPRSVWVLEYSCSYSHLHSQSFRMFWETLPRLLRRTGFCIARG